MVGKNLRRLEKRRARYEAKLGPEIAAIIESDTNVLTARLPERDRLAALQYREIVRAAAAKSV